MPNETKQELSEEALVEWYAKPKWYQFKPGVTHQLIDALRATRQDVGARDYVIACSRICEEQDKKRIAELERELDIEKRSLLFLQGEFERQKSQLLGYQASLEQTR